MAWHLSDCAPPGSHHLSSPDWAPADEQVWLPRAAVLRALPLPEQNARLRRFCARWNQTSLLFAGRAYAHFAPTACFPIPFTLPIIAFFLDDCTTYGLLYYTNNGWLAALRATAPLAASRTQRTFITCLPAALPTHAPTQTLCAGGTFTGPHLPRPRRRNAPPWRTSSYDKLQAPRLLPMLRHTLTFAARL